MRRTLGAFGRRDPTLFVASFAIYMALSGTSLLAPGSAFSKTPVYSLAAEFGLNEDVVGTTMIVNAALVAFSLGASRLSRALRSWLAYMSGALWVFWACLMLFSGLRVGFLSTGAVWTIFASFGLIQAAWPLSINEAP